VTSVNARYDGHADWYDETFSAYSTAEEAGFLRQCLGAGGIGPFVNRTTESADLRLSFAQGYGNVGWADRGSGDGSGVGGRVGFHHKSLASFLGAIAEAGLIIRAAREFSGGGVVLPRNLAVVAERS